MLSIAGSDPGGGAGIQADLKTFAAHGGYGMTVVTAITVQSTTGIAAVEPLSPDLVERQYRSVVDDIGVDAVKIGMLATAGIVSRLARCLETLGPEVPIVLDPVLAASDGTPLLGPGGLERLVEELLPRATVITPNRGEAEAILGRAAAGELDVEAAARELHARGPAVLVTGGDAPGDEVVDVLVAGGEVTVFRLPRLHTRSTHGTGCTLSSAIAARLAGGAGLHQAVERAIGYVRGAMDPGLALGRGRAPLDHGFARGARLGQVGATRDRR
ncbi:MAG TPA: bifunctional hydroxymethylpyrimidine kinase/phosphomethylpyrimidine kinase [Thermoanaerobaculia bacterium]|nr:bifunctional hydroxymethylpyrimidine kinase/phosphomethylpyrimidine kinase [Thermoanaerobaculia bacterium]